MAKLTLSTISSRYASVAALNANFDAIEAALENTLSRDGTTPNAMSANLDMNGYKVTNLPTPTNNTDAATKEYVDSGILTEAQTAVSDAEAAAAQSQVYANQSGAYATQAQGYVDDCSDKVGEAAGYASDASSSASSADTSALLAQDWAIKTSAEVDGVEWSSKHYALASATSATDAANSAATAATYSLLGLGAGGIFDFGLISQVALVFPTDFGTIA